jgi:pimeloyl-ACP methyl ester carboxylesterase
MPILSVERGEIYYEVSGKGFPLLMFAPGFLGSRIEHWRKPPAGHCAVPEWRNPIPALARDFKVITLDVRNAGRSWAEIGPDYDWPCYTADHLAVLDELGIDKCHVLGACIGVSFALALAHAAPGRIASLVLQNPIGLSGENRTVLDEQIAQWSGGLAARPDVSPSALRAVGPRMFGRDFVFSITRNAAGRVSAPTLLMPGNDRMHPPLVSASLARLMKAEVVNPWKGKAYCDAALERARDFLIEHTPGQLAAGRFVS